jgi:hypothetical protein
MTTEQTWWESFKVNGRDVVEHLKTLIHEGNVRHVVIKRHGQVVVEFPVTAGVVAAVVAPLLAAIGALTAAFADCTLEVQRVARSEPAVEPTPAPTDPQYAPDNGA